MIITIYINTIRRLLSIIMNQIYSPTNELDKKRVNSEIERLKKEIKTVNDIDKELKKFKWISDELGGLLDWSPRIETFLYRNKKDDCDGAAMYTKWLFNLIGIESSIYSLISKIPFISKSHVICVVKIDNKYRLYSNGYGLPELFDTEKEAVDNYKSKVETKNLKYYENYYLINY